MYGYSDYDGPSRVVSIVSAEEEEEDPTNPLQAGFWMEGDSLAPPCGTAPGTIREILQRLHITAHDVVYDLGCGDGRVCLEAWYIYHCRAIGVEVEGALVARAEQLLTAASAAHKVQVHEMDLRSVFQKWFGASPQDDGRGEFPLPTIVFLYLLPEALLEMEAQLAQLLVQVPHCRLVCNTWGIPHWKPVQEETIVEASGVYTTFFVYTHQSISSSFNASKTTTEHEV